MKICPKCGNPISYNSYFGAYICSNCNFEGRTRYAPGLVWLLIDVKDIANTLPSEGQPIYLSIAEGEGKPFTEPVRANADPAALRDLLKLHPQWLILWQPQPSPPPAPKSLTITELTQSLRQQAPISQGDGNEEGSSHGKETS